VKYIQTVILFNAYNDLAAELSNFKTVDMSQTIMWGIGGVKYRYISAFYDKTIDDGEGNITQLGQWYQPEMVNVFDQVNEKERSNFIRGTFAVTAGYAKSQNWDLGQAYSIIPGKPRIWNWRLMRQLAIQWILIQLFMTKIFWRIKTHKQSSI
jgi:putative ABC transport system permease protein